LVSSPRQLSFFDRHEPSVDASFSELERIYLGEGAWLEYVPGWLSGHDAVFDALAQRTRWRTERREMYGRMVDVPRLYAILPEDGRGHPLLELARALLSLRYATEFSRISAALYRNGRDSVAWHGDYVARNLDVAVVATVSVGAPRRFLVRPKPGGASRSFWLGSGDLLVMGGTCQRTFVHHVPKVAHAEPRIAIMFRSNYEAEQASS
jgi:alkylated DNA repair dioxygenase AlkB